VDQVQAGALGEHHVGSIHWAANFPQVFASGFSAALSPAPIVTVRDFAKAPSRSAGRRMGGPGGRVVADAGM
jgi:hypothetical protein